MTTLYQWYTEVISYDGMILHGIVSGHKKLPDGMKIHTSWICSVHQDPENPEEFIFQTRNTAYHLSMAECDYARCEWLASNVTPGIALWVSKLEKYSDRFPERNVSCGVDSSSVVEESPSILLRLGSHCDYYFDAIEAVQETGEHRKGKMHPHVGMLQDSVLCYSSEGMEYSEYDIRYFPYRSGNLEFYVWETAGLPFYIENCGDQELRIQLDREIYVIAPGSRVRMESANAVPTAHLTSRQDLHDICDRQADIKFLSGKAPAETNYRKLER